MKFILLKYVFLSLFIMFLICNSCSKQELIIDEAEVYNPEFDVSPELASSLAKRFTQQNGFVKISSGANLKSGELEKKEIKNVLTYSDDKGSPLVYVVSFEPEGFVIISGTKKEVPLLAFCKTGHYNADSLNRGISLWLNNKKEKIKILREDTTSSIGTEVSLQWDMIVLPPGEDETEIGDVTNEMVGPLLTTEWGQDYGFNDFCPNYYCTTTFNGRAKAGCVAVAQAQVMKYWEYPNSYDFSAMLNFSSTSETAELINDVGVSVDMNYGCVSSGAYTSDCVNSLENTFGYSTSASYVAYTAERVVSQLQNNWPVIMRGTDYNTGAGHAWVCDGYRRTRTEIIHNPGTINEYSTFEYTPELFYMHWGSYGDYNGWYQYDDFTPSAPGIYYNFQNCYIVQNIHP